MDWLWMRTKDGREGAVHKDHLAALPQQSQGGGRRKIRTIKRRKRRSTARKNRKNRKKNMSKKRKRNSRKKL